jgi:hypothetical protein
MDLVLNSITPSTSAHVLKRTIAQFQFNLNIGAGLNSNSYACDSDIGIVEQLL